jgi:uncharacterized protein (DUF924 family)
MNYTDILDFWFDTETEGHWFSQSDVFDQSLQIKFGCILKQASRGELWHWRQHAEGRLAEIIVLDQFSRNIYRHTAQAFAQDGMALILAQEAIRLKLDQHLAAQQRRFLYLPFMHSESQKIHQYAIGLFKDLGDAVTLDFEIKHKVIIDRFGRYPHRNNILGRHSTAEELHFLTQPNSAF